MSLGLLGAYESSSSSSSEEEEEEKPQPAPSKPLSNPFKTNLTPKALPKPSFMVQTEDFTSKKTVTSSSSSSVFSNPFREREDRKKALLEKHVAMTTKNEEGRTIDGKKVCWNFRKGRCRFGHKCTFAHDNDVNLKKEEPADSEPQIKVASTVTGGGGRDVRPPPQQQPQEYDEGAVISGEDSQGVRKKKRPGLSEGLVPGKKAMKFHNKVYNT